MEKERKFDELIWKLHFSLREAFFSKNISFSAIRLIFIKYAIDNCLGAKTIEQVKAYKNLQTALSVRSDDADPNTLQPVLLMLDIAYNTNHLFENSMIYYVQELFGLGEDWAKRNTSDKHYERIRAILLEMDLEEDSNTFEKGKLLVEALSANLHSHGETVRTHAGFYSRRELNEIINPLLRVDDNETYLDFASGVGLSTIENVGHRSSNIIHCDVNEEALAVSGMLLIMSGYKKFSLINKDTLDINSFVDDKNFAPFEIEPFEELPLTNMNDEIIKADKIFVDPPLGLKSRVSNLREAYWVSVQKAISSLNDSGLAIVTLPSSALFSAQKRMKKYREYLLSNGYIEAIISLPFTWSSTSVNMNLIILSKRCNGNIFFFNGCSEKVKGFIGKDLKSRGYVLSDESKELIVSTILNKKEIEGVSRNVDMEEIRNNDFDISPTCYVQENTVTEHDSLDEIDEKLKSLYSELFTNINVRKGK